MTRGQYTSRVEEGEQRSQRKNKARDTEQKKGTETMAHHEDHIKSAFLPQKIPHEVGVSEGKDEREQQDIPKLDPALHNHFLEFLSSAKATTTAASSLPSSSNEETAEGKSIRTNLSECKKVIKYLLRCLQGIKLSVENDGDIKSKVKTNNRRLYTYITIESNALIQPLSRPLISTWSTKPTADTPCTSSPTIIGTTI